MSDTVRVKLSTVETCEIITALKLASHKYSDLSRFAASQGRVQRAGTWSDAADRCLSLSSQIAMADSVEVIVDGYPDEPVNDMIDDEDKLDAFLNGTA